jgi:hypothetical protein
MSFKMVFLIKFLSSAANLLYENLDQDLDSEKRPESDPKACDPVLNLDPKH